MSSLFTVFLIGGLFYGLCLLHKPYQLLVQFLKGATVINLLHEWCSRGTKGPRREAGGEDLEQVDGGASLEAAQGEERLLGALQGRPICCDCCRG